MSLLTPGQAKAIYEAVCILNNVSSMHGTQISFVSLADEPEDYTRFGFKEEVDGEIVVYRGPGLLGRERETYVNQAAFAEAYQLE